MRYVLIALSAFFTAMISLPANAQYVRCGSVFVQPTARTAGAAGFARRECDPSRHRAGHNGSRGPYFIGLANAGRYRHPAPPAYSQFAYGGGQSYGQRSGGYARFSSSRRTSTRTVRHNSAAPAITGKMPTIDPKTLSREAYRLLGPVEVPPGVGYKFAVTANASDEPRAGCKVIKTRQSADGMYTLTRRVCPK